MSPTQAPPSSHLLSCIGDLRRWQIGQRKAGKRIGLVATMGALHEGHLKLIDIARAHADEVVVSIFVNPKQFAAHEDLDSYPSRLQRDCTLSLERGATRIFAPAVSEIYPAGFQSEVRVTGLSQDLCGASRPHFFGGVCTVVLKLLNLVMADVAVFGEKDYQQLLIIRQLATDLNHPTTILGCPIVREADGLAMSSRNTYLTPIQRQEAGHLHDALCQLRQQVLSGQTDAKILCHQAKHWITTHGGRVDYLRLVDNNSLRPVTQTVGSVRAMAAVFYGETRLIDNLLIS